MPGSLCKRSHTSWQVMSTPNSHNGEASTATKLDCSGSESGTRTTRCQQLHGSWIRPHASLSCSLAQSGVSLLLSHSAGPSLSAFHLKSGPLSLRLLVRLSHHSSGRSTTSRHWSSFCSARQSGTSPDAAATRAAPLPATGWDALGAAARVVAARGAAARVEGTGAAAARAGARAAGAGAGAAWPSSSSDLSTMSTSSAMTDGFLLSSMIILPCTCT
mmetsp:Transcript_22673/g.57761  ORF Transcript_22673/g.57761 Transcript_22673/m.57761 type:complete len:217 (+) Transcript_22673:298-948(+)